MWRTCLVVELEQAVFEGTSPSEPVIPGECNGPDHGILRWDKAQLLLLTFTGVTDSLRTTVATAPRGILSPARTHRSIHLGILMHTFQGAWATVCLSHPSLAFQGSTSHPDTVFLLPLKQPVTICIIYRSNILAYNWNLCCDAASPKFVQDDQAAVSAAAPCCLQLRADNLPPSCRQRERSSSRYATSVMQPAVCCCAWSAEPCGTACVTCLCIACVTRAVEPLPCGMEATSA